MNSDYEKDKIMAISDLYINNFAELLKKRDCLTINI